MVEKFLIKVVDNVVGRLGKEIVDLMHKKKDVNEFLIAKRLGLTINQTRNILYKLSDASLVSFMRKKDKRKGWYTYYWTLDIKSCLDYLKKIILKDLENLRNQLKSREIKRFYFCELCGIEMAEETALLQHFTCKECGEVYELVDNSKLIKDLKNKINKSENELSEIDVELEIILKVIAKKLEKEIEKEKQEKARIRAKNAKKRAAERKKLEKLNPKKKVVKKPKKKVKKKTKKKIVKKKTKKKVVKKKVASKKSSVKKPTKKGLLGRVFKKKKK